MINIIETTLVECDKPDCSATTEISGLPTDYDDIDALGDALGAVGWGVTGTTIEDSKHYCEEHENQHFDELETPLDNPREIV